MLKGVLMLVNAPVTLSISPALYFCVIVKGTSRAVKTGSGMAVHVSVFCVAVGWGYGVGCGELCARDQR